MSKRELNWMSRMSIYTPPQKIQPLHTDLAKFNTTGRTGARHWTWRCIETYRFEKLAITASPDADLRPVRKNPVWMLFGPHWTLPVPHPVETLCSVRSVKLCHNCYSASTGRAGVCTVQRPVDASLCCWRCELTGHTPLRPVLHQPASDAYKSTSFTSNSSNFVNDFDFSRSMGQP
jgi:hypothetical protein